MSDPINIRNALASTDPNVARIMDLCRRSQDAANAAGEGAELAAEIARIDRELGPCLPNDIPPNPEQEGH